MRIGPGRWIGCFAVLGMLLWTSPVRAGVLPPDSSLIDTAKAAPAPADSIREKTQQKTAEILQWLRQTEPDTADTMRPLPPPICPPVFASLPGTGARALTFGKLTAYPHTAFSDHLLDDVEYDAAATTEYATERMFTCRGLNPLATRVYLDGVEVNSRRLTFPQTMAPDLMAVPPYLFSSLTTGHAAPDRSTGEGFLLNTADSIRHAPFSDLFVRRGDYGLSLTQGRLFRPLPGRRTVNVEFSFAQSDGRWLYSGGNNRYLYGQVITPLRHGYNLALDLYQYRARSDIQTAMDVWRYNFRRNDLTWYTSALLFHGDSVYSPLVVRLTVRHSKQDVRSRPEAYRAYMKTSRAELAAMYTPTYADSTRLLRTGGSLALEQLHVRSDHVRRPEYVFWGEYLRRATARQALHLTALVDGNDHDPPGPQLTGEWRWDAGTHWYTNIGLRRVRITPSPADRRWPDHAATFENLEDQQISYAERGVQSLSPWWSNGIEAELGRSWTTGFSLMLQTWGSYEQNYYSWRDVADQDTVLMYQPSAVDARTAGFAVRSNLPTFGPFSPRLWYVFKRAEEVTGKRLPDYFDHRLNGAVDADMKIRKLNLDLHGSVEFMYWRAPSPAHTAYNRRDVFRTDLLGSATIKDFTIYWLAQNVFNYGYRKAPGFNYFGRTIMWGLHLRFFT